MNLTSEDIMYIKNVFYKNGYVLDFSDETFAQFCINSINLDIKSKYKLSKGKSLITFFEDKMILVNLKIKLLRDLIKYYDSYKENSYTLYLNPECSMGVSAIIRQSKIKCEEIISKYSGVALSTETANIEEKGLKELIDDAQYYRTKDKKIAVEKIWDALERLKTYFLNESADKKESVSKLIKKISHNNDEFYKLFNDEFLYLTTIGNDYRIRHHETNKIEIIDDNYYDYLFNRCLSLIDLSIKFLNNI